MQRRESVKYWKQNSLMAFVSVFRKENLFRQRSKSDLVVSEVERGVVLAHEDVAEDPEGTVRWRNVHSHETGETEGLAHL